MRRPGLLNATAVVVVLATAACAGSEATPSDSTSLPSVPAPTSAPASSVVPTSLPSVPTSSTVPAAPTAPPPTTLAPAAGGDPAPVPLTPEQLAALEAELDEIDAILGDLERDFAAD